MRSENLGFGSSKSFRDSDGLFWFLYTSRNTEKYESYPKILKYNTSTFGVNSWETDTLASSYFRCIDRSRLIVDEMNDRYYLAMKYNYLASEDTASNLPWDTGTFILCYQMSNDSLIYIKRHNVSTVASTKPRRIMYNYLSYSNGKHLLIQGEDFNNSNFNDQYCKLVFRTIDAITGNVISIHNLHDTPWSIPGFGATFINNEKDLLISYTESDTLYNISNQPYHAVRPTVARLDSNFNVVWKDTLRPYFSSTLGSGGCIEKFALQGDSTFVGAYTYIDVKNEGQSSESIFYTFRISNRNQQDGLINWKRDYSYYPIVNNNYIANYDVHDVENTLDGGYIFVGESTNFDSLNANAPGQLGYVLKTNCLGFLDDPEAGFGVVENDSLGVSLHNTSLMAGSYQWDFGDGTTLNTSEYVDTVYHLYSDTGKYLVQLIAFGCNGVNDTITQTLVVTEKEIEAPVNPNVLNYMALGPNPVKSGESIAVYIGNLPKGNTVLSFYDGQGKLVLEHAITQSKSTNIIVLPFGAGMYQAVLRNGEEKLEVEKVLVY